jgi:hypothetical protein
MPRAKLRFAPSIPESVRKLIRQEVKRLKLDLWTITVDTLSAAQMSANDDDGGPMETVAQVLPCQQYRKAQMWLLESTRATEDTRDTIRHELLHLLVHGMGAAVAQAFNTFQPSGTDEQVAYFREQAQRLFTVVRVLADEAEDQTIEHLLDVIE